MVSNAGHPNSSGFGRVIQAVPPPSTRLTDMVETPVSRDGRRGQAADTPPVRLPTKVADGCSRLSQCVPCLAPAHVIRVVEECDTTPPACMIACTCCQHRCSQSADTLSAAAFMLHHLPQALREVCAGTVQMQQMLPAMAPPAVARCPGIVHPVVVSAVAAGASGRA